MSGVEIKAQGLERCLRLEAICAQESAVSLKPCRDLCSFNSLMHNVANWPNIL